MSWSISSGSALNPRYDGRGFDSLEGRSIFHSFCKHPTECRPQRYNVNVVGESLKMYI